MKKVLLLIIMTLLFSIGVFADSVKNHCLVIILKNGDQVSYIVSEKPELTFAGENLCVMTSTSYFEYLRSDVVDFHFEETETGIETLVYTGNNCVTIYDISGHQVAKLKGGNLKAAKLLIDSFIPGMYIIKIGNQQIIKYLKK